jgi:hypothetical protein
LIDRSYTAGSVLNMSGYGRQLQFGLFVSPGVELLDNTFVSAKIADESSTMSTTSADASLVRRWPSSRPAS